MKIAKTGYYSDDIALVFFCAILSGVFWATLHRNFACAMLSQEYYDIIEQNFFM